MMLDENLACIRMHRNNIDRYRWLLRTKLSDIELRFIERRLAKELASLEALAAQTFPVTFDFPEDRSAPAKLERAS